MAFYDEQVEKELKQWNYQPNLLQFYDNVTYNIRWYMIPQDIHDYIVEQNKKGLNSVYVPDSSKIIIMETGVSSNYSLNSLTMRNAFGVIGSDNSININMDMSLIEVNGCSLFNKITAISKLLGYENPMQQPFFVDIWFSGYEPPKNTPINPIGGIITYSTIITSCNSDTVDSGTSWQIKMVGSSMGIVTKDISLLNNIAPIKAITVEDFRKSLEEQINLQYFNLHPELRKYFPSEDFVTIKLYSSEEFLNDTTQYQDNQTHINNEKDFNSVYGYDWTLKNTKNGTLVNNGVMYSTTNDGKYIPIGSAIPQTTPEKERQYTPYNNFKECIFDKVGENIDTANKGQLVMKMDNNQLLENIFQKVCSLSPQLRDRVAKVIFNSKPIANREGREIYKLTMNVFFKKNYWLKWFIETSKQFSYQNSNNANAMAIDAYNKTIQQMQLDSLSDMKITNGLKKRYKFLFNGEDTSVLELNTKIDKLWYLNSSQNYLADTIINTPITNIALDNVQRIQDLIDIKKNENEKLSDQESFKKVLEEHTAYKNLKNIRQLATDKRLYVDDIYHCLSGKEKMKLLGSRNVTVMNDPFGQATTASKTGSIDYNCAKAGFANLYNTGNLIKLKIKILGDPYWLDLFSEKNINGDIKTMMNLSNAKYFVFDMKTAVEQDMKGNGLYDLESAVDISGIYQVLYVTSYFENGKFTQHIEGSIHASFMHSNFMKV